MGDGQLGQYIFQHLEKALQSGIGAFRMFAAVVYDNDVVVLLSADRRVCI
jgi:hypothetical protein